VVLAGAIGLLPAGAASPQSQAAAAAAALSGGWKLNPQASVNPDGEGKAVARGQGISDNQKGPGPGGDLGREEAQRFNYHLTLFSQAPPMLGIQATAGQVLLAYDPDPAKGPVFKHATDNKKTSLATPAGPVEIRARWDGAKLRREIETAESLKVTEEYVVSADGKQLTVTVKRSSVMVRVPSLEIRRVYERVQ
jgi:hypothetical protein